MQLGGFLTYATQLIFQSVCKWIYLNLYCEHKLILIVFNRNRDQFRLDYHLTSRTNIRESWRTKFFICLEHCHYHTGLNALTRHIFRLNFTFSCDKILQMHINNEYCAPSHYWDDLATWLDQCITAFLWAFCIYHL